MRSTAVGFLVAISGCASPVDTETSAQTLLRLQAELYARAIAGPKGSDLHVRRYELERIKWAPGRFAAGVGRTDITPPPGFPTGGDGPAGNLARGYWTRLHARAFFFADPSGRVVVLATADLFAIPGGLTAKVAECVGQNAIAKGITIPPEAITIAATHTHQGPGNFMTASAYNQFASKFGGFSLPLFEFLVARICAAIDQAVDDARADGSVDLYLRTTRADRLQMNRSPFTFLMNADSQKLMNDFHDRDPRCERVVSRGEAAEPTTWTLPGCPRLRAADPTLITLEIRRSNERVGVLAFFAMHPTVLHPDAPVYSGDFSGVAVSDLEREFEAGGGRPVVVGFFNGAEGDVVARRDVRDLREVVQVAHAFEDHVRRALGLRTPAMESPAIVVRADAVGPAGECDDAAGTGRRVALAKAPVFGAAGLGGGEDDRTSLYALGFREGARYLARDGQGPKLPGLDSSLLPQIRLTHIVAPPRAFMDELPLRFMRIGGLTLASIPGEASTAVGVDVRRRLRHDLAPVAIIGLANEYSSYVASADEYGAQDYMAASTIWGPFEATVLACRLQQLADARDGPISESATISAGGRTYSPGAPPLLDFGPLAVGEARAAPEEELEHVLLTKDGAPARTLHSVLWQEQVVPPDVFKAAQRRTIQIQIRRDGVWTARTVPVRTSVRGDGVDAARVAQVVDDDSGTGFLSLLRQSPALDGTWGQTLDWQTFWVAPVLSEDPLPPGPYRFEVRTQDFNGVVSICHSAEFQWTPDSVQTRPAALNCVPSLR